MRTWKRLQAPQGAYFVSFRLIDVHIRRLEKSENDTLLTHSHPLACTGAPYQLPSDRVMPGNAVQPSRAQSPNGRLLKQGPKILPYPQKRPGETRSHR